MKRANYRAPREHRVALIIPAPAELPNLVQRNRSLLASYDFSVLNRPASLVQHDARRALLDMPYSCTADLRQGEADADLPIIITGHQPELYHPGVWLKNFLAGHVAAACGGWAVNVNVDNDEAHQRTIRAPVVEDHHVRLVEVPYLAETGGLPYEELTADLILPDPSDALRREGVSDLLADALADYWVRIQTARSRGLRPLAKVITCARHQLERDIGLANLEALVSDVARQPDYRRFVLDILRDLERFHAAYNGGLRTFRLVHHEKNPAQPMPDLMRDGPRWEMPFWVWRRGQGRQRLWAESHAGRFRLFIDGQEHPFAQIADSELRDGGARAIARLDELETDEGVKIRPRALTLTLFMRCFAGDLFIHGLGGAIYDKVTDEIARSYYGVEPPVAVMATGTALLPLGCFNVTEVDRRAAMRRLRDIKHNADRLMPAAARTRDDVRPLIDRKRDLVLHKGDSADERRRRWHELKRVNRDLSARLADEPDATRHHLADIDDRLARNAILKNREYPFALHPREELVAFYNTATAVDGGTDA